MAILVDNTPKEDGRRSISGQVSDIQNAREYLETQNSILNSKAQGYNSSSSTFDANMKNFNDALELLNKNLKLKAESASKADKEEAKAIQALLSSIGMSQKSMLGLSQQANETLQAFKKMSREGSATGEEFVDIMNAMDDINESLGGATEIIKELTDSHTKLNKAVKERIQNIHIGNKLDQERNRQSRDAGKTEYLSKEKIAGQDISKAIKEEIGKLGTNLHELIDTLNINKIAQQVAVSAKQQLQGELQTNYNLSGAEFEKFKHDLYSQIDSSIYSVEEVNNAMATLNTTALGNTQTATKYFNDIIKGQKVLGLTSETQQQLLKLGNITGRNELAFYQGTVAKFMNSSLGLNKQQLNELVQMNANLATQAADLGITSEAFQQSNMIASAAIERTEKGAAARMTSAESLLLGNTTATASLLGMDSGELSERLNRGELFTDILMSSNAGAKQVIDAFRNGDTATITRLKENASSAWGADASDVWSTLRVLANNTSDFQDNLKTASESSTQDLEKALEEMTKKETEPLNLIQTSVNSIANWFNDKIPWTLAATVTSIGVGVATIISLLKVNGNISEILKGLGGDKKTGLLSGLGKGIKKATVGKIAGLSIGKASGLTALGGIAGIATGTIMGISDAASMQGSTGAGWLADSARGFFLGTGSKQNSSSDNTKSVLGNTGKYAAIGAGIGTFFGPGLGTLIGGGIGALVGGISGLFGASMDNKKLQEEQNEKLEDIKRSTASTAYNTRKDSIGIVYRYRGVDNYSSEGAIGGISGGGYSGQIVNGPIGALSDVGHGVTSPYMAKRKYKDTKGKWHEDIHNGVDFVSHEGTKLYSNVDGTVTMNFTERSGANIVGVTDSAGYTHIYAHLQSRSPLAVGTHVNKGQFIANSGHTGVGTGPHLHYTVLKPGEAARKGYWLLNNTVDPGPFASSSIFNGDASSVISSANESSAQRNKEAITDLFNKNSTLVNLEALGGISGPVVNSIDDLKQTIIDLSTRTEQNEKILNMLTNRTTESPIA